MRFIVPDGDYSFMCKLTGKVPKLNVRSNWDQELTRQ